MKKRLAVKIATMLMAVVLLAGCAPATTGQDVVWTTPEPTATPEPTPVPTPEPTPEPDPIDVMISHMSDRELVGQMIMLGFYGSSDMPEEVDELMREYRIGNLFLFGWNIDTFSQTKRLTDNLQDNNYSRLPLLIGTDVEGGNVVRFKWDRWPSSAQSLGRRNNPEEVRAQYKKFGDYLTDSGININFAPVLDISSHPDSTFLGKRMFGGDPEKVAPLVSEAVIGLHEGNIAATGKHFPGHGDTATDSHSSLPVMHSTYEEMQQHELVPFQAAIDSGLDAMLVGHLSYPEVDSENMASLSYTFITEILREDMGFEGVVFSDDIRMGAVTRNYTAGEAAVRFIEAGGDIVLCGKFIDKQRDVCESIMAAVESGRISRERLEESVRRIIILKMNWAGLEL